MTIRQPDGSSTHKPDANIDSFGEIALLMNTKRTATVTSISECQCWVLKGDIFKQIIAKATLSRRHLNL